MSRLSNLDKLRKWMLDYTDASSTKTVKEICDHAGLNRETTYRLLSRNRMLFKEVDTYPARWYYVGPAVIENPAATTKPEKVSSAVDKLISTNPLTVDAQKINEVRRFKYVADNALTVSKTAPEEEILKGLDTMVSKLAKRVENWSGANWEHIAIAAEYMILYAEELARRATLNAEEE